MDSDRMMTQEMILHPSGLNLPALIAGAGDRAAWRFVEFFTVNIRNPNTRAASLRDGTISFAILAGGCNHPDNFFHDDEIPHRKSVR